MLELLLLKDQSEVIQFEDPAFPVLLEKSLHMLDYLDGMFPTHRHHEMEWVVVRRGSMYYTVGASTVPLSQGDQLLVNSGAMHGGHVVAGHDCLLDILTFLPETLFASDHLRERYLRPVVESPLQYCHVTPVDPRHKELSAIMRRMSKVQEAGGEGLQLAFLEQLMALWRHYLEAFGACTVAAPADPTLEIQNRMLAFVMEHYTEAVSLDDIARAGGVSRNRCCSLFREYAHQTPIDYLGTLRLSRAATLLRQTDRPVTQVALDCGFNHLSYFSKCFSDKFGMSPSAYRRYSAPAS